MSARTRITEAAKATQRIDGLIFPAIDNLRAAVVHGNGAGVYSDVSRVRGAIAAAKTAIAQAELIVRETPWPSNEDYDAC